MKKIENGERRERRETELKIEFKKTMVKKLVLLDEEKENGM